MPGKIFGESVTIEIVKDMQNKNFIFIRGIYGNKIYEQNELWLSRKSGSNIPFPGNFTDWGVYDSVEAFNELIKVKQRDEQKPFTLMVAYMN